ncbi:MAG TPA: SUMF1/EgtB/PvdO family nonheme iron enzyme, partial [Candidatus Competibacteraceae bacterium]|nr:SUMF1/EgtB/PvdO family nonheme iron enzyme [Candidatus Competibacteraceae bacterium]
GEPLSALLRRQTLLSEQQLYGLLQEVLPALEAVHEEGYLHRDLKPSNLYIRARDGCVMLIDFGAARQSLSQRSKSVTGLVTPGYSPPEQYITRSDHYGPWTDIYALGAVLYRCTVGKPPIEAPDRQMWDTLVPAQEAGAGRYPAGFLAVIDKALAMHPEERFQTVTEMREALAAAGFDITRRPHAGVKSASKGRERSTEEPSSGIVLASFSPTQLDLVEPPETPAVRLSISSPPINPLSGRDSEAGAISQAPLSPVPRVKGVLVQHREAGFPRADRAEAKAAKPDRLGKRAAVTAESLEPSRMPSLPSNGSKLRAVAKAAVQSSWDSGKSVLHLPPVASSEPDNRRLRLVLILAGLLALLSGMAYKIYQSYQERLSTLKAEQLAQEIASARSAAQEEAQRQQRRAAERQAQDYLKQARLAVEAKDWVRVAAYLEQAETLQPDNPQLAAMRAELAAAQQGAANTVEIWVEPSIDMPMVRLKRDCFVMGTANDNSTEWYLNETQHRVCIEKNFWISQHEITNAQFRLFRPQHNSGSYQDISLNAEQQPVTEVSWSEANAFARWLSEKTGRRYRLPTEAEWEYAARATSMAARYWGDDPNAACNYANVADRTAQQVWGVGTIHQCDDGYAVTAPVASYRPNAFKLYDMLGNVSEWTCSEFKSNYDKTETRCTDDHHQGGLLTVRGGSWKDYPRLVRAADRNGREPDSRDNDLGFRLVLEE